MVSRSIDAPRAPVERIKAAELTLTSLQQAIARGASTLRAPGENANQLGILDSTTAPVLVGRTNTGVYKAWALALTDDAILVTDLGINQYGPFNCGDLTVTRSATIYELSTAKHTGNFLVQGGVGATSDIQTDTILYAGSQIQTPGAIFDSYGNVRNGASSPEVKQDIRSIDPAKALASLVKLQYSTFAYIDGDPTMRFAGFMLPDVLDDELLATMVRDSDDDGVPDSFDIQSMVGLVAAALPAINGSLGLTAAEMGPLKAVAQSLPSIVAHSDIVHEALQTGQDATNAALAAANGSLGVLNTLVVTLQQTVATVGALAAATSTQSAALQSRTSALEARASAAEAKASALEARLAALEAKTLRSVKAIGNLPAMVTVGATADVSCPWSTTPSVVPTPEQCQAVLTVPVGSTTATVKSTSTSGVVVTVKAGVALNASTGAVSVIGTVLA